VKQTEDQVAAQAIFKNNESLAEGGETGTDLSILAGKAAAAARATRSGRNQVLRRALNKSAVDSTEQEEMILMVIMRHSLAEYNHQNSDTKSKYGADNLDPLPDKPLSSR
jgi:hypothetical protein